MKFRKNSNLGLKNGIDEVEIYVSSVNKNCTTSSNNLEFIQGNVFFTPNGQLPWPLDDRTFM